MKLKWISALVLVLMLAGSVSAMAQQQSMDDEGKAVGVEAEVNIAENHTGKIEVESGVDVSVSEDSEKSEVEVDVDTSTETPAGETQTEVSIKKGGIAKPAIQRERISERLKERIQKYTMIKNTSLTEKQRVIKVREQLHIKIQNARQASIEAANKYTIAKQNYLEAKKHGIAPVHARTMLHTGSDYMERWLDRIELAVINSEGMNDETKLAILDKIDEYSVEIADKKAQLNETEDIAEMKEIARELNDYWKEVRLFIRSVVYQLAAEKLENVIEKADDVSLRIREKIEEMKAAGEDTAKLEELLADYEENIELARENVEEAKDTLSDATTLEEVREGHKLIIEASRYLKDAFKDVRLMTKEYRKGVFFGNETGELFAKGDGKAVIQGTGIIVVQGNGTVTVDPDTAVKAATGFGAKTTGGGISEIKGKGVVVVRGENVAVTIEGVNLKIVAKGHGSVYLEGNGTYKVKKLPTSEMIEEEYDGAVTIEFGGA